MGCCLPSFARSPSASPLIPERSSTFTPELRCRKCRVALFPTVNAQLTHEKKCTGTVRIDLPPAPLPPDRALAELPPKPKLTPAEKLAEMQKGLGGAGVGDYLEKVKSKRGVLNEDDKDVDSGGGKEGEDNEGGEGEDRDEEAGAFKSLRKIFSGGKHKENKGKGHIHWLQTSYR